MSAALKRHFIFFLLPSIFIAANCPPGKFFIISFVSFKFFLDFFLVPLLHLDPLDEAGFSTSRNENQKRA